MIRDALIVALRAHGGPMRTGEFVEHMPWMRRDQRSPHFDDYRCEGLPEDEPRQGRCVRVLSCSGAIHTVEFRPQSYELNRHLNALTRQGLVRPAEGTVVGRRFRWELTETGAATGEIEQLRAIVELDAPPPAAADVQPAGPVNRCRETIDWQRVVERLAHEREAGVPDRSHLMTADTYRYCLAGVLGAAGVPLAQLENTGPADSRFTAMTLYGRRRVAIGVADLRDAAGGLSTLAAHFMNDLHRTARLDADERVLVVIGGPRTHGQVLALLPGMLHASGEPIILWFQHALRAGLTFDGFAHDVPDLRLTRLGRHDVTDHHLLAIGVRTRSDDPQPGDTT